MAGILQTFGNMPEDAKFDAIVRLYAPALTATGSGLFAALVNILPIWIVLIGRDLIRTLSGDPAPPSRSLDAGRPRDSAFASVVRPLSAEEGRSCWKCRGGA